MTFDVKSAGEFPRALADGLWMLGNYFFNLYFVQGKQAGALIEVGVSAIVDDVIGQMEAVGIVPTFLVVTHPHADHVTGLAGLRKRYPEALVVAPDGAREFLDHPKAAEGLILEDGRIAEFLESHGIRPGRPPVDEPPSLENCLTARDGDEMDLGGRTLRFIRVTGHSPGAVAVHVPEIEALLLSDSLGFRYPGRGVFPLFFTGYSDYMETLDRLRSLEPAVVGPAHQGPLTGIHINEAFDESRRLAMELRDKIRKDPRDPDEIAGDVFETYYRDEMTMYTEENILNCAQLVVKRARE
ncbi:MAG: MBL fold metallo-hydrolase [Desulfomonilaceae bacterium]|nr:MBL fold metallo-hydrolase [Desulfomonilaceae bacterium]